MDGAKISVLQDNRGKQSPSSSRLSTMLRVERVVTALAFSKKRKRWTWEDTGTGITATGSREGSNTLSYSLSRKVEPHNRWTYVLLGVGWLSREPWTTARADSHFRNAKWGEVVNPFIFPIRIACWWPGRKGMHEPDRFRRSSCMAWVFDISHSDGLGWGCMTRKCFV